MKIGSLVECINGNFIEQSIKLIPNRPKKGKIYTIRGIVKYKNNEIGVLLEEITNEVLLKDNESGLFEPTFDILRFRELPEADILELKEICELINY
jgi:hypothetical protein